ncbi:motility associated factor glycosyltransferase family protein [Aliarcobacter cryaerophilus]|uniref:motility associated factor glycosyltransferase family protein n=1 Tax=Aliarcobacter cryaerophilus TaxID=28198 RepID=UPI003DA30115
MTEAQIQLQNALTTTFLANLAFLSEYDNELYHRVDELSRMIERGEYKEKYALEFNMQDGDFDIYDIVNDKYLYNKNPKKFNSELLRKSEQYEGNYILDLAEHFSPIHKGVPIIDKTNRFEFENMTQFNTLSVNNAWEYLNAIGDYIDNKKKRLKNIKKFIFLGTLLGRHIPKIAKNIDANMYLVLERNLEIFRLSLFTVDYTILAKKHVTFSIMDNVFDTETKISRFFKMNYLENYLIKFSTTTINIEEYIDNILNSLHILNPVAYDYTRMLYVHFNRATKYIKDGYKFLLFNKTKKSLNLLKNIPVLYIAAGPSLDDNIDWIKKNHNRFFIVTIGAAYKKLLANDIHIDIISTLDQDFKALNEKQFDDESVEKISKNTIIFASNMTNENILKKFNKDNLFLYEVFSKLHKDNIVFQGFSVGEITLNILLDLNIKELYLIGLDLALNQETGESHSKDSNSATTKLNLNEKINRDTYSARESLIKVKGNYREYVYTTPMFFSSIKSLEEKVKIKSKDVVIYNLSTNGAFFNGVIPVKQEDINLNELKKIEFGYDELIKKLKYYSLTGISSKSKEIINKEIGFIEKNIIEIIDKIKKTKYKNFEELLVDEYSILTTLDINNCDLLYQILVNYFQISAPYLLYHFNDIKIKDESKKVKKIQEISIRQIISIIEDYLVCLKRVI